MPKITRATLRERGICNDSDIARYAGNRVYLYYHPYVRESLAPPGVFACGIGFNVDSNAWSVDNGNKWFGLESGAIHAKRVAKTLLVAQGWVSAPERGYVPPNTEWERSPFGGWHPAGTVKRAYERTK